MKKSQLRKLIRESIKQLITEQTQMGVTAWVQTCGQQSGLTIGSFCHPDPNVQVGDTFRLDTYYSTGPSSGGVGQQFFVKYVSGNPCQVSYPPPQPPGSYSGTVTISNVNQGKMLNFLETNNKGSCDRCCNPYHWQNSPMQQFQFIAGGYCWVQACGNNPTVLGCTDSTAFNYDPNATQDDGSCDYGWRCKEHWKQMAGLPGKCVPGTAQNPGQFTTKADCIASGCEPIAADDPIDKDFTTPFTTTPQSIVEPDDEITRMQDLANIKNK